jgi:uncharacterized membrane protein YsdA (DUF1294 family)
MYGIDKWKAKKFKYGLPAIILDMVRMIGNEVGSTKNMALRG